MAIYSRCVNAREKLDHVLKQHFRWCEDWHDELKQLFDGYVDRKESAGVLDYDDLLLFWHALLDGGTVQGGADIPVCRIGENLKGGQECPPHFQSPRTPSPGDAIRKLFDCVLVDEYQDTNLLQAEILYGLSPEGKGLTVVGDDAQSIYAFRAATVRNILDFPKHYKNATVVTLEQNYRSTQPILEATNGVIGLAHERYAKNLWSERADGERPWLVNCEDDTDQAEYVIRKILEHREAGVDLRRQAVLFRASHHSILLEAELARANIPFHKYGGLKFVEAAHVKDLMAFLRLAENPRDMVSGSRLLPLLPGIGPGKARQLMDTLLAAGGSFDAWADWRPPAGAATIWPKFVKLLIELTGTKDDLPTQVGRVRKFYTPLLEAKYDHAEPRLRDLEQLELIASRYRSRSRMLLGTDARSAEFNARPRRPVRAGRRLSGPQHDSLGKGSRMGRGLRDPRRRWQHSVRHGHEKSRPRSKKSGGYSTSRSRGRKTGCTSAIRFATTGPAAATITVSPSGPAFCPTSC